MLTCFASIKSRILTKNPIPLLIHALIVSRNKTLLVILCPLQYFLSSIHLTILLHCLTKPFHHHTQGCHSSEVAWRVTCRRYRAHKRTSVVPRHNTEQQHSCSTCNPHYSIADPATGLHTSLASHKAPRANRQPANGSGVAAKMNTGRFVSEILGSIRLDLITTRRNRKCGAQRYPAGVT